MHSELPVKYEITLFSRETARRRRALEDRRNQIEQREEKKRQAELAKRRYNLKIITTGVWFSAFLDGCFVILRVFNITNVYNCIRRIFYKEQWGQTFTCEWLL